MDFARRSTTFPLPSSPHWRPTTTTFVGAACIELAPNSEEDSPLALLRRRVLRIELEDLVELAARRRLVLLLDVHLGQLQPPRHLVRRPIDGDLQPLERGLRVLSHERLELRELLVAARIVELALARLP